MPKGVMSIVKQFINDMIHMTEGEKLISYWWLWLLIVIVALFFYWAMNKKG